MHVLKGRVFKIRKKFCIIFDRIIKDFYALATPNGVRLAHEILTNFYSYNQTQGFMGDKNLPMTNKKLHFCFVFLSPCTNFAVAKDEVQ